jgi:hypothetical protein
MKSLSPRIWAALVALLAASGTRARADFMDWTFDWSMSPSTVMSSGTGTIAWALNPDGPGAATIPVGTITTSSATDGILHPADVYNNPYTLTLTITDTHTNTSNSLTFGGVVQGTLITTKSTLGNTFTDPVTQVLTLAGHDYRVTMSPTFTTLPAPGSPAKGLLNALVVVTDSSPGGPPPVPSSVPEPASVILAGCGCGLGLAHLIRARRLALARAKPPC